MKITENVKFCKPVCGAKICFPTQIDRNASYERLWHQDCLKHIGTHFPLFPPRALDKEREGKKMKVLQKIIFTFAMVIGLSMAVSAQKNNDQKKPPPKENPPVVTPNVKKPPKNDDRPKRPGSALIAIPKELFPNVT
jgi:hypothetical protein